MALILLFFAGRVSGQQPPELVPWLTDQTWHRDVDGPRAGRSGAAGHRPRRERGEAEKDDAVTSPERERRALFDRR